MIKKLSFYWHNTLLTLVSWVKGKVDGRHFELAVEMTGEKLFKPRADDIYIVSSPKSGTTLMQMMLYQMTSDGAMDFPHITARAPWYDLTLLFGRADLLEALPSPRLLKSHARRQVLPRTGRFIYITRNVRDVAVSCFHHANQLVGMDHDLEKYLDLFLEQDLWFTDIVSWWPHRHDDNVLCLFFDDVIRDLEGTVRKVAKFLDLELDEENIPRILERCSIGFMKKHNAKFDPRHARMIDDPADKLFARTLATGLSSTLTADQDQKLGDKLKALVDEMDAPDDDRNTDDRGMRELGLA